MFLNTYGQYVTIALAAYCIIYGVKLLLTGRASQAEEMRIRNFTERAQKKFRLVSAFSNILAGVFLVVISVFKLVKPDMDITIFKIISLGVLVLLVVVYVVTWQICKKDK